MGCIASSNHVPLVTNSEGVVLKCATKSPSRRDDNNAISGVNPPNKTATANDSELRDSIINKENVSSSFEQKLALKASKKVSGMSNEQLPSKTADDASPVLAKGQESEHQRLSNRRKSRFCDVQIAELHKLELEERGSEASLVSQVDSDVHTIDPRKFDSVTNFTGVSNAGIGKVNMKSLYQNIPAREA